MFGDRPEISTEAQPAVQIRRAIADIRILCEGCGGGGRAPALQRISMVRREGLHLDGLRELLIDGEPAAPHRAEYQLARARLPAGRNVVEVRWRGKTTRHEVVVEPGGITVLPLRRY